MVKLNQPVVFFPRIHLCVSPAPAGSDLWTLMDFLAKPDFVLEKRKEQAPSSGGKSERLSVFPDPSVFQTQPEII